MIRRTSKPKRRFSCDGKRKWPTRQAAENARHALGRAGAKLNRLRVYRCEHCWIEVDGQRQRPWHVGHRIGG